MLKNIGEIFLLACLLGILYLAYLILKPFLFVILISAVMVTISYPIYNWIVKKFNKRRGWAAFVMCALIVLIIIIPVINFIIFLSKQSVDAYGFVAAKVQNGEMGTWIEKYNFITSYIPEGIDIKTYFLEIGAKINEFIVSGATTIVKGTTGFITSFLLVILTMFFFYRDGNELLKKVMRLTPLSNKYDREIFNKFQEVSHSAILATFVTAILQGVVGAIGFMIIGIPALFLGVAIAFGSLIPFVGTAIVWLPVGIILLLLGKIGSGIFIIIWGIVVIGLVDNVLKPVLMKGKAKIHPLFIFFSILGGIIGFGFWGFLIGPLVIALASTFLYIYELEFDRVLDKK